MHLYSKLKSQYTKYNFPKRLQTSLLPKKQNLLNQTTKESEELKTISFLLEASTKPINTAGKYQY